MLVDHGRLRVGGPYQGLQPTWIYGPWGNRKSETFGGTLANPDQAPPIPGNSSATYNANNQVASVNGGSGFTYDASGDVMQDSDNQYLYDADGRICAVEELISPYTMTQYIYDAEGRRVGKGAISTFNCNTATNRFSLTNAYLPGPNGQQLTEISVAGGYHYSWGHTNVWAGSQLIATDSPNGSGHVLNFEFNDWLGTRRILTDSAGNIQQTCNSLPYGNGEDCPTTPTEHLFTGKERDAESGNDYFKYRYYASSMGRWLSPDPSGLSSASLSDPQSLNLYDY